MVLGRVAMGRGKVLVKGVEGNRLKEGGEGWRRDREGGWGGDERGKRGRRGEEMRQGDFILSLCQS